MAATLTPQETRIIELIAAGQANKIIASELSISVRSVERFVTAILQKLNAANRTEAAIKYLAAKHVRAYQERGGYLVR